MRLLGQTGLALGRAAQLRGITLRTAPMARLMALRLGKPGQLPQGRFFSAGAEQTFAGQTGPEQTLADDILKIALANVPINGWDLTAATRELGLSDQAASLFPNGSFDLVLYYLETSLRQLKNVELRAHSHTGKVVELVHARLLANTQLGPFLGEAVSMLAEPKHLPTSLSHLNKLADEIWFLAGDRSNDSTWYARRGSLAAIYAASEAFMVKDTSPMYKQTMRFSKAQIEAWSKLEQAEANIGEWLKFNAISAFNVAKSLTR